MPLPVVALVGRPNVGKSTLFNRLTGRRTALVQAEPGVTRDRLYGEVSWRGRRFRLVDTGGVQIGSADPLWEQVRRQVEQALQEADLLLFVVDGRSGCLAADHEVAEWVRRAGVPALLVVNKVEGTPSSVDWADFYALGLGDPVPVSAEHGQGAGDLLDAIANRLWPDGDGGTKEAVGERRLPHRAGTVMATASRQEGAAEQEEQTDLIRVAVVGRPNVGKSSLVNRVLGSERVVVSEIPGTTRDPVDTPFNWEGNSFVLVDTAGLRRPGRVEESLEQLAFGRAAEVLERSDVAILVLDATEGILHQDQYVAGLIQKAARAVVVAVNKMDRWQGVGGWPSLLARVRQQLDFLHYAEVVPVSAKTGQGIPQLLRATVTAFENFSLRLSPGRLGAVIQEALSVHAPPTRQGRPTRIYAVQQVQVRPPTIVLKVNDPQAIHFSYLRYLENTLRREVPFTGSPLRWQLRQQTEP